MPVHYNFYVIVFLPTDISCHFTKYYCINVCRACYFPCLPFCINVCWITIPPLTILFFSSKLSINVYLSNNNNNFHLHEHSHQMSYQMSPWAYFGRSSLSLPPSTPLFLPPSLPPPSPFSFFGTLSQILSKFILTQIIFYTQSHKRLVICVGNMPVKGSTFGVPGATTALPLNR